MLTRRDPYVNLLRGTVAGFAAGVGGADAVTVPPFDAAIGGSEPFSRRIARNTQALLVDESHLARVIDPAGGSWFVESLTGRWPAPPGRSSRRSRRPAAPSRTLDSGLLAERIGAVRARGRGTWPPGAPLTGVSGFPDLDERPVTRAAGPRGRRRAARTTARPRVRGAGATGPMHCSPQPATDRGPSWPRWVRRRVHGARRVRPQPVQAGGIEPVEAGPTDTDDEVAAAFTSAGTPVAVLCSTDRLYTERAARRSPALREAGAGQVLLAGRSTCPASTGT